MKRNDVELMAPVGSLESLMAAIQGGADAVYFGIGHLNMRARSSHNFTMKDVKNIVDICNKHNVRPYLALNTVIYDEEMDQVKYIIHAAKTNGIHAIIAADHSVLHYANEQDFEVHISTQVNISNIEAVKFYSKYADVIVLARELSLPQIKKIIDAIKDENITGPSGNKVRIELFVHGALCMAISGKCYLNLHQYNHSANRGECFQICRKAYTVSDKEDDFELDIDNQYIMSPKDLCTIPFLNKILDTGVSVLKIEGRARSPEYVKTVTQIYNESIHAYIHNGYTEEKIKKWENTLLSVFNRGFWGGYYLGKKTGEWSHVYGSNARKRKKYIGKCTNYFNKIKVAEFKIETDTLKTEDEILIIGPTTGVVQTQVKEIRVDLNRVQLTKKGDSCSIPVDQLIRRSDKLYKIINTNLDNMQ